MIEEKKPIIESREIRYMYSPLEAASLGKSLASANGKIEDIKERKKASASQYAAELSAEEEQLKVLNRKVGNGYEYRYVNCTVEFHVPEKGQKTLTRTDLEDIDDEELKERNMERTWTDRMEDTDWDNWNDGVREVECSVEFHVPEMDKKTYTQTLTGHKFIEQMSQIDIENWEEEAEETLNKPEEGQKTFVHPSGVEIIRRMDQSDIDRLQTSMFEEESEDLETAPTVEDNEDAKPSGVEVGDSESY